uniref:Rhodanese domain-containing protein n=1 Tax=Loa loa TaxID=7209 RepID=A0A1I7VWG5_LOALO
MMFSVVKVRPDDIASQITLVDIRSSQQLIRRNCSQTFYKTCKAYFGPSEHGIFAKLRLLFESEHNWERLREHLNSAKL